MSVEKKEEVDAPGVDAPKEEVNAPEVDDPEVAAASANDPEDDLANDQEGDLADDPEAAAASADDPEDAWANASATDPEHAVGVKVAVDAKV